MASRCRSCGVEIRWALTEAGKAIPLEVDPRPGGNLLEVEPGSDPPRVRYVDPLLDGLEGDRWVSHFANCPDAGRWRK